MSVSKRQKPTASMCYVLVNLALGGTEELRARRTVLH